MNHFLDYNNVKLTTKESPNQDAKSHSKETSKQFHYTNDQFSNLKTRKSKQLPKQTKRTVTFDNLKSKKKVENNSKSTFSIINNYVKKASSYSQKSLSSSMVSRRHSRNYQQYIPGMSNSNPIIQHPISTAPTEYKELANLSTEKPMQMKYKGIHSEKHAKINSNSSTKKKITPINRKPKSSRKQPNKQTIKKKPSVQRKVSKSKPVMNDSKPISTQAKKDANNQKSNESPKSDVEVSKAPESTNNKEQVDPNSDNVSKNESNPIIKDDPKSEITKTDTTKKDIAKNDNQTMAMEDAGRSELSRNEIEDLLLNRSGKNKLITINNEPYKLTTAEDYFNQFRTSDPYYYEQINKAYKFSLNGKYKESNEILLNLEKQKKLKQFDNVLIYKNYMMLEDIELSDQYIQKHMDINQNIGALRFLSSMPNFYMHTSVEKEIWLLKNRKLKYNASYHIFKLFFNQNNFSVTYSAIAFFESQKNRIDNERSSEIAHEMQLIIAIEEGNYQLVYEIIKNYKKFSYSTNYFTDFIKSLTLQNEYKGALNALNEYSIENLSDILVLVQYKIEVLKDLTEVNKRLTI